MRQAGVALKLRENPLIDLVQFGFHLRFFLAWIHEMTLNSRAVRPVS